MIDRRTLLYSLLCSLPLALFSGCQRDPQNAAGNRPLPIGDSDECHVCGMTIKRFPGPKGEAFVRDGTALKFCSTRDLFAFLTQPENAPLIREVYVHDMAATDWYNPDDAAFTDARPAHYVIDHPLAGAMGPTLASFQALADAQRFAAEHRGRVLGFDAIDAPLISQLAAAVHG